MKDTHEDLKAVNKEMGDVLEKLAKYFKQARNRLAGELERQTNARKVLEGELVDMMKQRDAAAASRDSLAADLSTVQEMLIFANGQIEKKDKALIDNRITMTEQEATIADLRADLARVRAALDKLYVSSSLLRVRISERAPVIKRFSDWDKHSDAMTLAQETLKP